MTSIFEFLDYRKYLRDWVEYKSKDTKGVQSRIAQAANVSTTLISRILSGDKHLSAEQAVEIAEYIGLNENETRYFILLVEIGRAGSRKLLDKLKSEAIKISSKVSVRVQNSVEISEATKSVFYSSWIYAAIRNITATPGRHDVSSLARRLGLTNSVVANALDFLVQNNLCKNGAQGIQYSSSKTHLDLDSRWINVHHRNWRQKSLEIMEHRRPTDLFFSAPMSLSAETAVEIRKVISRQIELIMKKIEPSPSEIVCCLNIDWFQF